MSGGEFSNFDFRERRSPKGDRSQSRGARFMLATAAAADRAWILSRKTELPSSQWVCSIGTLNSKFTNAR